MENLRRKEHDTSATISAECSLAARTKVHHLPLLVKVVGRGCTLDWLSDGFHSHRLVLISGPSDQLE